MSENSGRPMTLFEVANQYGAQHPAAKELAAKDAEIMRLREALEKYGAHSVGCPAPRTTSIICTCGYSAALGAP